jgi:hypothetical protein
MRAREQPRFYRRRSRLHSPNQFPDYFEDVNWSMSSAKAPPMSPRELRKWIRVIPFQPFRLELSSGTTFEIRHPELAAVNSSTLRIIYPAKPGALPEQMDRDITLNLFEITSIEAVPTPLSPSRN